jgi:hypothetical protein
VATVDETVADIVVTDRVRLQQPERWLKASKS